MQLTHCLKIFGFAAIVGASILCSQAYGGTLVKYVDSPSTKSKNKHYIGNRAPLVPRPLIKLPIGSIKPQGWLRKQLELMADGFTGRLPELSEFCTSEGNAWLDPKGQGKWGWEEVPYWLKGYTDLGYIIQDKRIIDEAKHWLDAIIASQRPDGYFGPQSNRENMDLWPNMCALYALRSYYEATGDKRVLTLMSKYFRWQSTIPLEQLLPGSWQKTRAGDNLDSIYWLYNQTGEKWLLDVARVNHERTSDWTGGIASWHGVNIGQCFREPGVYYQQTRDIRYLRAAERNYNTVMNAYGQVPGGGFGADENCRPGYNGPRQGTETCTWAELMWSHELLCSITGSVLWADRCEEVAFNSLPASMTPDLKGLHYLTAPNQIQLDRADKSPMIQNAGDMFSYNPYSYRCCQHNIAFAWPYFAEHLWMATPDNGLAAVLYSACKVNAKVGSGDIVKIVESTSYPFDETISLSISTSIPIRFPLYLRIPGWCLEPRLMINNTPVAVSSQARGWLLISREWKNGDKVRLELPMAVRIKTWESNRNTVSVYRGPLAYSLKIGEDWRKYGGSDKWPAYEVFPTTPWNYGLVLDQKQPEKSFRVETKQMPSDGQPFRPDSAPIVLKARGKRIPEWKQEANGLIGEVGQSPVRSDEPIEEITLIPMGCARLRISSFPVIGEGPEAAIWDESAIQVMASHVWDTLSALNDGVLPQSSADLSIPRFTWWDHRGTSEWVQYAFNKPRKISCCEVYWFDDTPHGGLCRVPASWRVLWWDGKNWQPATGHLQYGTARDKFNRVEFDPVETTMIRLDVRLDNGACAGILEWRVCSFDTQ